jgi:hypothetical protein
MAATLEQRTAAALGEQAFRILSLTAQCDKQQDEIADLKQQLAKADEAKPTSKLKAAG